MRSDLPQPVPSDCLFINYQPLTVGDVTKAAHVLPDKQYTFDPLPKRLLLKEFVDDLAPFLTDLFNQSFAQGVVPHAFKVAYITLLLKKPDLDAAEVRSYQPISNLSVLSKMLERLVK